MSKKVIKTAAAVLALAVIFSAGLYRAVFSREESAEFVAMDTFNSLKIKGAQSRKAAQALQSFVEEYDTLISAYSPGGFVSQVNTAHSASVPAELRPYLDTLFDVNKKSGGAFDFALGGVSALWGIGTGNQRVPSAEELGAALAVSGCDRLTYDGKTLTSGDGALLDLGAAGKGMALDEIKKILPEYKVSRAVVSLGGGILLYGEGGFTVGIQNPSGGGYIATLTLGEGCVSTSGNYERYFIEDGVRYHHIIDPDTGCPVQNGLAGVTILSQSGVLTDALSTACFVLGEEKGSALCGEFGCTAVFVYEDGGISMSGPLELEITDENYHLRQNGHE